MSTLRVFKDCYGVQYHKIEIMSNGLCGFSSIAYCLNGDSRGYRELINESFSAFEMNPDLFAQQTELGRTVTLNEYKRMMTNALSIIPNQSLPRSLWMEDGHLVAYSLMFDICIFVYNAMSSEWLAYNENGKRGYICLFFSGSHYDVLIGMESSLVPPVPLVTKQVLNNVSWNDVFVDEHKYSFGRVWNWPENKSEVINIDELTLNSQNNVVVDSTGIVARPDCPVTSKTGRKNKKQIFCTEPGCSWGPCFKNWALDMHKLRKHVGKCDDRGNDESNVCQQESNVSVELLLVKSEDSQVDIASEMLVSDSESMCSVELCSVEGSSDSDSSVSSTRSTRSNSKMLRDIPVVFKTPLPRPIKETCKDCGNSYVNLSKHLKCSKKLLMKSIERKTSDPDSELMNVDDSVVLYSNTMLTDVRDQVIIEKVKCEKCFVSLLDHCVCAQGNVSGDDTDEVASELSMVSVSITDQQSLNESGNSSLELLTDNGVFLSSSTNVKRNYRKSQRTKHFVCCFCDKILRSKLQLKKHEANQHAFSTNPESAVSNEFVLISCAESPQVNKSTVTTPVVNKQGGTTQKTRLKRDVLLERDYLKEKYLATEIVEQVDPLYDDLKQYQQELINRISNITTERLSEEILEVVENPDIIGYERPDLWSVDEHKRLNKLNIECKKLQHRNDWYWDPKPNSAQFIYNEKRMQFFVDKELVNKLVHCKRCQTTSLMVGLEQVNSDGLCYDCLMSKDRDNKREQEKMEAWDKVRPVSQDFPKRQEPGHTDEDLPYLYPGEKSVIALNHPCVTIKKTYGRNKKLRQESITLLGEPDKTWVKVLPRKDLKDRFFVLERTANDGKTRHIVANRDRVEQWLRYLLKFHPEFKRRLDCGELEISSEALESLNSQSELANVDTVEIEDDMSLDVATEFGLIQPALESGFVDHHILSFDKFPNLYLKQKEFMKIKQGGKIEIITDDSVRRPIYSSPANLAFPSLFPHGELSPLDFNKYLLGEDLLRRQVMFAHRMCSGKLEFSFANDDVYLMHAYAKLCEMRVNSRVNFYMSVHPSVSNLPMDSVLNAFKNGFNDQGLLDSKLPDLTMLLTRMPNSRHYWFRERQALETISRDLSDACLFMTINPEPRHSPDIRALIHSLHCPDEPFDREWNFKSTEEFTELMSKYAPHVSVYLYRKVKLFLRAYLNDICRIDEKENVDDWTSVDKSKNGFFWLRQEHTQTRGFCHFHCMIRLPNTLDTGVLARMVHNMRVVRVELKKANIKASKKEEAWDIIRFGLLASHYLVMLADSISTASYYTERVESFDSVDPEKVIDIDALRAEFEKHSKAGTHTMATHPLMRKYSDPECPKNPYVDIAEVACATSMHFCITNICGGLPKTSNTSGSSCRFSFPKKQMKCTVPCEMQVNAAQSEVQVILRRTNSRVCNSNPYILRYLRCNNDLQFISSAVHGMRYCTKYCTKSAKHDSLVNDIVSHFNARTTDLLQPTMKRVLSQLILADCSHRAFMSKHELSWHVMGLPDVWKSFSEVQVVGFYPRANICEAYGKDDTIIYSDRTPYSCYAERCREDTVVKYPKSVSDDEGRMRVREEISRMCLREFSERVSHKWQEHKKNLSEPIDVRTKRKFKNRNVTSGHWILSFYGRRQHMRSSIRLFTKPAIEYEAVEVEDCTSQTAFYDQSREKREQLLRSYYELVFYVSWQISPDSTFLSATEVAQLSIDPESEKRYSLRRLQFFFKVYETNWKQSLGPNACKQVDKQTRIRNEQWFRDNQYSYSMHLAEEHNSDIRMDRIANKGVLSATYDDAEELRGSDISIRPALFDDNDDADYPSVLNFSLPFDGLQEILEQPVPELSEICVTFPLHHAWQKLEDVVRKDKMKMFMAKPPLPTVQLEELTFMQRFAYDCMIDKTIPIVYLTAKAGAGKTLVSLMACQSQLLRGHVQCAAGTARAASLFNAPTIHSALQWGLHASSTNYSSSKIGQMQVFYENTVAFVFDEINCISRESLGLMHESMTKLFNPSENKNAEGDVLPFGGLKIIFLGDSSQLGPVLGNCIFDETEELPKMTCLKSSKDTSVITKRTKGWRQTELNRQGEFLYRKYLLPNVIVLKKGQRNAGLLQEMCDRIRDGTQTREDLAKLTYMRRKFPEACSDYGIFYDNESCGVHNLRQLWTECRLEGQNKRLYICKATYDDNGSNQSIVDGLASLPDKVFSYAPNILCLSEGCLVRIVKNINLSAGLVNGALGRVIKVLYDNADLQFILEGKHPVPSCVIIECDTFQGYMLDEKKPTERFYPFDSHHQWVPIFRQKLYAKSTELPAWIRKQRLNTSLFRFQFALNLSSSQTAHRIQGQSLAPNVVNVSMNLENPDNSVPNDIASILYVALTRVRKLEDLLVSQIFPSFWDKIGHSDADDRRRKADRDIIKAAEKFSQMHGVYDMCREELDFKHDYSSNVNEWKELQNLTAPRQCKTPCVLISQSEILNTKFTIEVNGEMKQYPICITPVSSERHLALDQGRKHFAVVCVDKVVNCPPRLVGAELYNLGLSKKFNLLDLASALMGKNTKLMDWMQLGDERSLPSVERVIVHLEQMSIKNQNSREFTIELGTYLQSKAKSSNLCVVKLSQANVHRKNGPMFKMGDDIVKSLSLTASTYQLKRSDLLKKRAAPKVIIKLSDVCVCIGFVDQDCRAKKHMRLVIKDYVVDQTVSLKQSSSDMDTTDASTFEKESLDDYPPEYRRKKQMSADIFRYVVNASPEQQIDLGIDIDPNLQEYWKTKIANSKKKLKLDDLGDSFLISLDEMLTGSTNYRQLVSSASSINNNRSVVLAVLPHMTYFIVMNCQFNLFVLEDIGSYVSKLEGAFYRSPEVEKLIEDRLDVDLRTALTDFGGNAQFQPVNDIKMIVKQLQGLHKYNLTRAQAGSLTETAYSVMKNLADKSCAPGSQVYEKIEKSGHTYMRTDLTSGRKFHVMKSSGKHLNAVLTFLEWFKEYANRMIEKRDANLNQSEKLLFFETLEYIAMSAESRLEMMKLSDVVIRKLGSGVFHDDETKKVLADLILISINRNQSHVKAIAANFRKVSTRVPKDTRKRQVDLLQKVSKDGPTCQRNETCIPRLLPTAFVNPCVDNELDELLEAVITSSTVTANGEESRAMTSEGQTRNVRALCNFLGEAMGPSHMHLDLTIEIEQLIASHNLKVVKARVDGYCLIDAWASATNSSEAHVKAMLLNEFNSNLVRYTMAGIDAKEFYNYLEYGTYTSDAADSIIDLLCNASHAVAIIIGKKYTHTAPRHSTVVHGVTEIRRIGVPELATLHVLLLKSDEHYDSFI